MPPTKRSSKPAAPKPEVVEPESVALEPAPIEEVSGAVVAQDVPAPVAEEMGPIFEEQWLILSCRHGEVAHIRAGQREFIPGNLYACRRCGVNRFVRQIALTQSA